MTEIKRIEDVDDFPYKTNCTKCGKKIELWYNGGELDIRYCCGYSYRLENVQIDFVIQRDN